MIKTIRICDFAIIKEAHIDFHKGLNIITGETGSGKSVVATAISLALGSRADAAFIRHGCDKATIELEAEFDGENYKILREISSKGKNQCKINDVGVPLGRLVSLFEKHAQIHGQFDNTSLLDPETHIDLLDTFGSKNILSHYIAYINAYNEFSEIKTKYNSLITSIKEDKSKADYYAYTIQEIDNAALIIGEDKELDDRVSFLQNSEAITKALSSTYDALSLNEFSAENSLGSALSALQTINSFTKDIDDLSSNLDSIYINLSEVISELRRILDSSTFSQSELDECMERLATIDSLKKKYGGTIYDILEFRNEASKKMENLVNFDYEKNILKSKLEESRKVLYSCGEALTRARKDVAKGLSSSVEEQLIHLNFKNAEIEIKVNPLGAPTPKGMDEVEIYITTNKGEPLKPLAKVASGGEVSRIMLAIKAITAEFENISSLIFDEVDTGISGITASIVGNKLKDLSLNHQVISITHLPQIAAKGDYNYRIYKESNSSETFTYIEELSLEEKTKEIARLLGGTKVTETTMKSAKELIDS
ncbi:DNA repair protein RecN [Eubacteriales bacterium KG127]